ncbi:putative coiled coil protein [Cryptosporidium canis]|uniref:Coiled coil protein n=1 Tax=Cryptosporidium canis TaxID=195482 RepID=A0A9D5DF29_9CRYT|nr:putative coiled coil protein [Cryptosporidium canis]
MGKRSKEEGSGLEDDEQGLDGTQQSRADGDGSEVKPQGRPARNSRKVVKYTDFEDEDDEFDDFESDFDDLGDLVEEEDGEESDREDEDLNLEDEDCEMSKKSKKGATKKKGDASGAKQTKTKKAAKEAVEEDFDSDEERGAKASKKKKLTAPKNLSKRIIASSGGGGGGAGDAIFSYMKEQNRPYSVQNVVDNLHNVYSKRQVTDEMDRLAAEGKFVCKEYGKQKVYLVDQSDCKELNKEEMEALDKMISASESELNDLEAKLKQLKQETRHISVPLPIEVLEERIGQESLKNESLREEISRKEKLLDGDCEVVPVEKLKELKNTLLKKQAKLKSLKSTCKSVLDTFSESMEKKVRFKTHPPGAGRV